MPEGTERGQDMDNVKKTALDAVEAQKEVFCKLSDDIWDHPELGFHEEYAAKRQMEALAQLGFENIKSGLGGIPTAFSGSWGHGRPVIAMVGEFDALADMSQKAGVVQCDPVVPGGNGHGCGHNLLGAGAIAAAYGVKEYLRTTGREGTVIYFGCPAEENGSGKAFLTRDGVFEGLDCALYWHPSVNNAVSTNKSLANFAVRYRFKGISAHASDSPQRGRSALDAVELMNTGVQYLREHVPSSVRMHYAITDAGGISPNVVQAHAEVFYLLRAPRLAMVRDLYERVNKIARGAAMMTETEVEIIFKKACSDRTINMTVAKVVQDNLDAVPKPEFTKEEMDFLTEIRASTGITTDPANGVLARLTPEQGEWVKQQPRVPICQYAVPLRAVAQSFSSNDLGDVSKRCPTGYLQGCTWAAGTAAHSWQAVAQGKSSTAHKGMLFSAKVLAGAAVDLFEDAGKLAEAKAEFDASIAADPYVCPLPKDLPFPMD